MAIPERISFWLLTCLLLTAGNSRAQAPVSVSYCDHPSYPPLSWTLPDTHMLVGIAPDIITDIFTELGYTVEITMVGNWQRCMYEAQHGMVDAVIAYKTPEREKYLVFTSNPLIKEEIAVFINAEDRFTFNNWDDLKGKTAGMLIGESYGQAFDEFLSTHARIERVSNASQNFKKLAAGRIDFVPMVRLSGLLLARRMGLENIIVPSEKNATTDHLYIALRKSSRISSQLQAVDQTLERFEQQGHLKALIQENTHHYLEAYKLNSTK